MPPQPSGEGDSGAGEMGSETSERIHGKNRTRKKLKQPKKANQRLPIRHSNRSSAAVASISATEHALRKSGKYNRSLTV
jgi:hypothetical protein